VIQNHKKPRLEKPQTENREERESRERETDVVGNITYSSERKSALNKRLSSLCAAKKERERKQRVRLLLLLLQLPSGFITLNETAILR